MTELEGFKFVTTLVLEFKKIESDNEKDIAPFIRTQRLKQLLTRVILMMFLNKYVSKSQSDDETKYSTFSLASKAETIINESDTDDVFE